MNGRSFSFIDGVLMVASVSAVCGLLRLEQISERAKPVFVREWPGDATLVELIVASISFGVALRGAIRDSNAVLDSGKTFGPVFR